MKPGDRKIRNHCIIVMVSTRGVAFDPKFSARPPSPISDFALGIRLCTYLTRLFDEGRGQGVDVSKIGYGSQCE